MISTNRGDLGSTMSIVVLIGGDDLTAYAGAQKVLLFIASPRAKKLARACYRTESTVMRRYCSMLHACDHKQVLGFRNICPEMDNPCGAVFGASNFQPDGYGLSM